MAMTTRVATLAAKRVPVTQVPASVAEKPAVERAEALPAPMRVAERVAGPGMVELLAMTWAARRVQVRPRVARAERRELPASRE